MLASKSAAIQGIAQKRSRVKGSTIAHYSKSVDTASLAPQYSPPFRSSGTVMNGEKT
ncbi:hypothetical protein [Streptomyces sp. NBC_00388]|uniref:hypothetical protein n=1 Tax=Streptomyces sp. NBC_00388 TaxID=2975735 RepID=UPI002E1E077A